MKDAWVLAYDDFDPRMEGLRESLCTLGNGYLGVRGAAEEAVAGDVHYPGTYLAGGWNRLPSQVSGRTIHNEDLVNFPNWLPLNFRPEDGDWLDLSRMKVLSYRQELHLREGVLIRRFRVADAQGRVSAVRIRRFVHMRDPHLAAIEYTVTPENWSGTILFRSLLDGSVRNRGVARYRQLSDRHLRTLRSGAAAPEGVWLEAETTQSRIVMAQASRTRFFCQDRPLPLSSVQVKKPDVIGQDFQFEIKRGASVTAEKIVAVHTSLDPGVCEPADSARRHLSLCGRFAELLASHRRAWETLWSRCDVELKPAPGRRQSAGRIQTILRLHAFHLLQTASPNTVGRDFSTPARGLHGEAYRGHVFWDEIYIFPFYRRCLPEVARSLLMYRYRRLNAARALARAEGLRGAMFPWQSSSDGSEETQVIHYNPRSNKWDPDHSRLQRHINIAIVYNTWKYFATTDDMEFMERCGAEMMVEICRYWESATSYHPRHKRYEIKGVMGPDEYHEAYPGAGRGGLDNNAYTNVMVVWCLERTLEIVGLLSAGARREVEALTGVTPKDYAKWKDITRRMKVPQLGGGIISQFDGYEKLKEFDWEGYRKKYGDIGRLDRILKAEGDSPDPYKLAKQPDTCMLFYLLKEDECMRLLKQLGCRLGRSAVAKNVQYYFERSAHGSTLSKMVFAILINRKSKERGWEYFLEALKSDVEDAQGGTTPEGIHLGAMAGTINMVVRQFAGLSVGRDGVRFQPELPAAFSAVRLPVEYRGALLSAEVSRRSVRVRSSKKSKSAAPILVRGRRHLLKPGQTRVFKL
ncbi:MAG: glycosyl hydrolase family 65 protein [Elusimicrobiota bacterium]